jgi:hypothetical protein
MLNFGHLLNLPRDFAHAGLIYSLPLITIGAASAFGWMLAYLRGPIVVSGWISGLAGNDPYKIMFALVALLRAGAADGVEIRRRAVLRGVARIIVDLCRVLRDDRGGNLPPRCRAVAAEALFRESVGCFKNPSGAGYICP